MFGWFRPVAAAVAALLGGCLADLELPTPPDLAPLEQAYDQPSADLTRQTAERIIDRFVERQEQLAELGEIAPIVDVVIDLDRELTTEPNEDGGQTVVLKGIPIETDARIDLFATCPGWGDGNEQGEAVQLTVVVVKSELVPVIWGEIDGCRVLGQREQLEVQTRFSAQVSAYSPTLTDDESNELVVYVLLELTELEVRGALDTAWAGDMRFIGARTEFRIDLSDEGHVIVFAQTDPGSVGVRAANGEWTCIPLERRCQRTLPSSDSLSY